MDGWSKWSRRLPSAWDISKPDLPRTHLEDGNIHVWPRKLCWSIFCYQQWRKRKLSTMEASSLFKDWFFIQIIYYTGVINALETEFQALIKRGTLGSLKYNWFCCCKEHKSFMIVLYDEVLDLLSLICLSLSHNLFPWKDQKDLKYPRCHIEQRNYKLGDNLKMLSLTFWISKFLVHGIDIENAERVYCVRTCLTMCIGKWIYFLLLFLLLILIKSCGILVLSKAPNL